jgi:hypothetical protein
MFRLSMAFSKESQRSISRNAEDIGGLHDSGWLELRRGRPRVEHLTSGVPQKHNRRTVLTTRYLTTAHFAAQQSKDTAPEQLGRRTNGTPRTWSFPTDTFYDKLFQEKDHSFLYKYPDHRRLNPGSTPLTYNCCSSSLAMLSTQFFALVVAAISAVAVPNTPADVAPNKIIVNGTVRAIPSSPPGNSPVIQEVPTGAITACLDKNYERCDTVTFVDGGCTHLPRGQINEMSSVLVPAGWACIFFK